MIVIGYGTGRCGTQSLASFLNQQKGFNITHEAIYHSWYQTPEYESTVDKLLAMKGAVIGDIAYYWIKHLNKLFSTVDNLKVINITRDIDEVIESFWTYNNSIRMYMVINNKRWFRYPFDDSTPSKDSLANTIRKYKFSEDIINKYYGDKIYHMDMEDLNNINKLHDLLTWLGVDCERNMAIQHVDKKRVFPKNAQIERPIVDVLGGN